MKNRVYPIIKSLLFFIILLTTITAKSQQKNIAFTIDSLLLTCLNTDVFNGAAIVSDKGQVVYKKGVGFADEETRTPIKTDDPFYIGKITEQFTALLILQYHEDQLLSIHDSIGKYFVKFRDPKYNKITLHHLLTHSSGLYDYLGESAIPSDADFSFSMALDIIESNELLFKAGEKRNYCHSNYLLLGKIVEAVGKGEYMALVNQHILQPLKMINTGFSAKYKTEGIAKSYKNSIYGVQPYAPVNLASIKASAGMYSTLEDLYKWESSFDSQKLLSDSTKRIYFKPFIGNHSCGWEVKNSRDLFNKTQVVTSNFNGYQTLIWRLPGASQSILLVDNHSNKVLDEIRGAIQALLNGDQAWVPKPPITQLLYNAHAKDSLVYQLKMLHSYTHEFKESYNFKEENINKVGYELLNSNILNEALSVFELNNKLYPNSWKTYHALGDVHKALGNTDQASEYYSDALLYNRDDSDSSTILKMLESDK